MSDTSLSINNNFASSLGSDVSVGSLKKANLSAFDEDFPPGTPQREEMIDLLKEFGISTDPSSLSNLTKNRCDDLKNTMEQLRAAAQRAVAGSASYKENMQTGMDWAFRTIQNLLSILPNYKPSTESDFSANIQNHELLIKELLNSISAFDHDFLPGSSERKEMLDLLQKFHIKTDAASLNSLTWPTTEALLSTMGQLEITAKAIDASTATPEQKKQSMQKAMDLAFNRINSALSTLPGYQPISEADFSTTIQNDDSLIQKLLNPK